MDSYGNIQEELHLYNEIKVDEFWFIFQDHKW